MLDEAALSSFVYSICKYAFLQYFATLGFELEQVVCLQIPIILPEIVSLYFLKRFESK